MNGRLPVAVVALALVVAGLAGRVAVRTLQTARHGDARDFAILDAYYQHPGLAVGAPVLLAGIKTYGLAILTALTLTILPRRPAEAT
jgi:hypothetical protein